MNWQPIIEFLGGATAISLVLGYLGKRAIDSYASGRLEAYKSELELLSNEHRDALTRKRDVYGRVATFMRVFLTGGKQATDDQKRDFLIAFDQACLWASEDVALALVEFLQLSVRSTSEPGSVTNEQFKEGYRACLVAMRRDCGFPETTLKYPVVTFK
jgi:hypothetical protein